MTGGLMVVGSGSIPIIIEFATKMNVIQFDPGTNTHHYYLVRHPILIRKVGGWMGGGGGGGGVGVGVGGGGGEVIGYHSVGNLIIPDGHCNVYIWMLLRIGWIDTIQKKKSAKAFTIFY